MSNSIHSDVQQTVRVGSRRFELSPFHDCWANEHTVMGVYAGRYYSVFNGEDITAAYWALRRKAALYDVPERPVEISGRDAVAFLERVFARRISSLKEGRGRYAIACTPKGGVFMDGILFRLAADRFWYVQPDGALETWFHAHSEGFDVTISDPQARVLQIQGPTSFDIMHAASGGAIDETMGYFHSGFFSIGGQQVYVSRTGWTGELGFEIYTQGEATDCPRLWRHLVETGEPHGMVVSSISSMEIRRLEAGILDNGTDFDMSMTPFEAGLDAFVDLDKEDFIGRTALLDGSPGTRIYGVKSAAATPLYHGAILEGDSDVARITAGAWSPYLEAGIGYARFHAAGSWAGKTLMMRTAEGETVACEIVELPFYDREKRIPRGLDKTIP
ncbi:glycine cleavage T C-terminal barrel domain-containing protein [Anderseniella sp. Alg231-50]|uniref:glycine cleavage T C-terminal barrel domain-containing protein n=1 Tax=Anderseniella sp. Alg231-50 TaxID=1922226 RepID=UPI000D55A683